MTSPEAIAATSVGISARVFRDLHQETSVAARVVLAASVVDDVLGLLLLSFLVAVARGIGSPRETALIGLQAIGFLAFSVFLLPPLLRRLPRVPGTVPGLVLCLAMGWGAYQAGLAPIVGAFACGLALGTARIRGKADAGPVRPWDETSPDPIPLRTAVRGLTAALVALFFVELGPCGDLRAALLGRAPVPGRGP